MRSTFHTPLIIWAVRKSEIWGGKAIFRKGFTSILPKLGKGEDGSLGPQVPTTLHPSDDLRFIQKQQQKIGSAV